MEAGSEGEEERSEAGAGGCGAWEGGSEAWEGGSEAVVGDSGAWEEGWKAHSPA